MPWMTTSLFELESHAWHFEQARGTVVVAGLGLGVFVHAVAQRPDVDRILVIEQSGDVAGLLQRSAGFRSWPNAHKIEIVLGSAGDQATWREVVDRLAGAVPDYLFVDIWPELSDDNERVRETAAIAGVLGARRAGWWGQELACASWCVAEGLEVSRSSVEAFFARSALGIAVSAGYVGYCEDVALAFAAELAGSVLAPVGTR